MEMNSVLSGIKNIKIDKFILSLLLAIVIAFIVPKGASFLHLKQVTEIGIGLIFFFYGLKLSFSRSSSRVKKLQTPCIDSVEYLFTFSNNIVNAKTIHNTFSG